MPFFSSSLAAPPRLRRLKRRTALAAVFAVVLVSVFAVGTAAHAAAPVGTPDQSNPDTDVAYSTTGSAGTYTQIFTAGLSGYLTEVDLVLRSATGSGQVQIETLNGSGLPSGTVIGTGVANGTLSSPVQTLITSTAPVVAGTQYAIALTIPDGSWFKLTTQGSYAGGGLYIGSSYFPDYDLVFTTYVADPTTRISGTPTSNVPVNHPYTYDYTLAGSPTPTTTISVGAPPEGLTLSSDGEISGTPTVVGTYDFTVRASNGATTAIIQSTIVVRAAAAPDAPTAITATAGSGSASVSWSAPTNSGDDPISGYTVTASPGGATCTTTTTSCTITGLTPGTAVTFSAAATSASGTGAASVASNAVIPYATPSAPASFTVTPGDSQVELSWVAPADGFSPLTGYVLEQSTDGGAYSPIAAPGVSDTAATITGLINGTEYSFRLSAVNVAGTGTASDTVDSTPFVFSPSASSGTTSIAGTTVSAGGHILVQATGLPVGSVVTVQLHSTVATLATITIGSDGVLNDSVVIPAGTAAGAHTLTLTLTGTGADPVTVSYAFTVAGQAAALAFTGGTVPPAVPAGAALIVLIGAFLLVSARRRRGRA